MSWELPMSLKVGVKDYAIHGDFRDILDIFRHLNDRAQPEFVRWQVALALFYEDPIPEKHRAEAMEQMAWFLSCGRQERDPGPRLLDWEQDAHLIVADVNKVAGTEIRALPFLHWWTFLSYFHGVGEGQLSTLVSLREKLRTGKKLEPWEQEYYRKNRAQVELKKQYSPEELAEKERLEALLGR